MFSAILLRVPLSISVCLLCVLAAGIACADDTPAEKPDFKKDVLPILDAKCIRCHGEKRKDGKLDLRSVESMLTGGVTGPAIQPGNAQKSLLIELIHFNEMPPKKATPRIKKEELELLRTWIDAMPVGP